MTKRTRILVVLLAILIFALTPAYGAEAKYKVRSTVYDSTDPSISEGDFYWDANTFSGFWYKIKPGLSSEVLYINNENSSATLDLNYEIEEGDLYYVSKPQTKKTKIGGMDDEASYVVDGVDLKKYYLMGFFGSEYVSMPKDPAVFSEGCQPDKIAKILMESDDDTRKQMFSGAEWELADGWTLVVQQVDVDGNKVWLQLNKDGVEVDTAIVSGDTTLANTERTYLYKDADDYPVFYCYVDSIFRGTDSDFVVLSYPFLRGDLTTIESGDSYGVFDVDGFVLPEVLNGTDYAGSGSGTVLNTGDSALVMSSNDDISLKPDTTVDLYDGMYFQILDTKAPVLKLVLWKTCKLTVPDAVPEPDVDAGSADDEVVVVNMAENTVASTPDIKEDTTSTDTNGNAEEGVDVESSISAPGFEALLAFAGLICVSRILK